MFFEEEEEITPFNLREQFVKGLKDRLGWENWTRRNKLRQNNVNSLRQAGEP